MMIRRGFAIMLGAALLLAASGAQKVFAKAGGDSVDEIRAKVTRLGVGEKARVEVRLHDERKLRGHVRRAGEQSFDVTEDETGVTIEVAYTEAARVRRLGGGGMSGATKAIIWGGVAAGAAIVLYGVRGAFCDGC